ncbi:MAG: peptide deformylase [Parcubacteria group bacterium]|nr:peptide deformylase [Parcubacteria group bacterium]
METASPIRQLGDPVLRKSAVPVAKNDIGSKKISSAIKHMSAALRGTENGVAIAAPQMGISLRIFLVLERAYKPGHDDESPDEAEQKKAEREKEPVMVFINPKILRHSRAARLLEEGCLSVDGQFGKVRRYEKVTVEALDERGKKFTRGASGLFAQVVQHEIDHLEGIIFVDKATDLHSITSSKK